MAPQATGKETGLRCWHMGNGPFVAEEETEFLFYTDGPFDYFIDEKK